MQKTGQSMQNEKQFKMILGLSMPGGTEWIIIIAILTFLLLMPILAVIFYARSKVLKRQVEQLTQEKNELLNRLLNNK